ncbi:hypothetical protein CI238_12054 [Colletotrichum incanum]|uniref:Uncharacterized protein n=1 Tax=Colletotrichum incanum TaxID=1573173 RepID=A0A166XC29_COLIC|nr:hypothetical protein CI238_12054 [Colletotrichum incanum]
MQRVLKAHLKGGIMVSPTQPSANRTKQVKSNKPKSPAQSLTRIGNLSYLEARFSLLLFPRRPHRVPPSDGLRHDLRHLRREDDLRRRHHRWRLARPDDGRRQLGKRLRRRRRYALRARRGPGVLPLVLRPVRLRRGGGGGGPEELRPALAAAGLGALAALVDGVHVLRRGGEDGGDVAVGADAAGRGPVREHRVLAGRRVCGVEVFSEHAEALEGGGWWCGGRRRRRRRRCIGWRDGRGLEQGARGGKGEGD